LVSPEGGADRCDGTASGSGHDGPTVKRHALTPKPRPRRTSGPIARTVAGAVLLLVSLVIGGLLVEAGARLVLDPADYLSVTTVPDEVLGIRVAPGSGGFDSWGFRNRAIPASAEIVAVGDSHTYGNNATLAESWPAVVGTLTGRTVYNLGLGGYGPNQYFHLFMTRALVLRPRLVICGLYMGDDFENAFLMTYGKAAWAGLRSAELSGVDADIWKTPDASNWHQRARIWLSQHSIVYRLVVHGPIAGRLKALVQIGARHGEDAATTSLIVPEIGIREAFRPISIRDRLDQNSLAVQEGMRITFELLRRMDQACREHGCRLLLVVIPTKETVFAEYLLRDPTIHLRDAIADVVEHERVARERLIAFLDAARVPYVDTLAPLRSQVSGQLYTRSDQDMHPGRNGYRVIGQAVAEYLRRASSRDLLAGQGRAR
jgi:hypothetical protein